MPVKNHIKDNKLCNLREAISEFLFFVPKHLTESPQEDKIICTWLLRGALHKDHFSKITTWLAFIPYFWKPSCFLRLPLLPLFLLPSLPPPLPSLSCFSFHMLVLFFLIFPLCKKWKAENRMSEGKKGRRQKQRLYIGEITVCSAETALFSALTVTDYNTAPNPIHIHHSAKPNLIHRQCKTLPLPTAGVLYQSDILTAWQEEQHWSATGSCIKNIL